MLYSSNVRRAMEYVTGADILGYVGVVTPSPAETEWSDAVAAAVNAAIDTRLNGAILFDPSSALDEVKVAARIAGAEAFKRREATWGLTGYSDLEGNAIRVAKDYLAGVAPMIDRHSAGPGIA
jgi:hypothetical protein